MPPLPRFWRICRALGLFAVMLALAGRVASGMVVADAGTTRETGALLEAMIQCHADAAVPGHVPPKPAPHAADHGLCSWMAGLDLPCPTLASAVPVPPPRRGTGIVLAITPPARSPPALLPGAALPRGPPLLA